MRFGLLLLLLIGTLLIAARPAPTPAPYEPVVTLVTQLLPVEEEIEDRCWKAARATCQNIEHQLAQLPDLDHGPSAPALATVRKRLRTLRHQLELGDPAASYQAYFDLRQGLFDLLDALEYPSVPTLLLVHHDLENAQRAAQFGKAKDVTHELNELEFNYRSVLPALVTKGISQQQTADFLIRVSEARDALDGQETPRLLNRLATLEQLLTQQQKDMFGD